MTHPVSLPEGYILDGRYVLGTVSRTTAGGIVYTAFDKKLRMMVEVLEYLPGDCALQRGADGITVTGNADFSAKRERLVADGVQRMHSSESNIYDVLAANGTAYLVHVTPQNNAAPAAVPVSAPAAESAVPGEEEDQTKIVTGILPGISDVQPPAAPVDDGRYDTAEELIQAPETPAAEAVLPAEEEASGGPSVRMLLTVLAAGIILLLICCGVFLTSLFKMTDLPGENQSLLGVPYTEIGIVTDEDWLVIGRGSNDGYAPGTVIAEEEGKNGYRVLINAYSPSYVMPELTGMTADGAASLLNRTPFTNAAGLVQGQLTVNWVETADAPHGMVLDQSPAAGTVVKSSIVTITAAKNPAGFTAGESVVMADLVGKSYDEASETAPLLVSNRIVSDKPAGEILSQYPAAGTSYRKGAPCYVVVSLGTRESCVPDVQFMSLEEAEKTLQRCGLSLKVEYALNSHVQTGLVAEQSPASGESIAYGETVTLTVSGEGSWTAGPQIQNELTSVVLDIGDTCTMDLNTSLPTAYYSTAPDVVSVSGDGLVTALSSGSAVVSASSGGQTAVMFIQVSYTNRLPCTVEGSVGEKISLPALGDASEAGTVWYTDETMASITEDGVLTGKKAGSIIVRGEKDGRVSLYLVTLTETETETAYITIAKSTASNKDKMQKALTGAGLKCSFKEEYNSAAAGTILRVQYTGYSDVINYYFAEGTDVTLVISKGQPDVSSVSVAAKPARLEYAVGEKLDTTGLKLKVVYADKSEEIIEKGFTVSYDFTSAGRKTVAVSYEQRKTSFAVEVVNKGPVKAEIVSKPTKLTYDLKESLNTAGLQVKVTYGDGTSKIFKNGFTTKYSFDKAGTSRVTVTVEGVSAYFDVTVAEKKVRSIRIETPPTKTVYQVGDTVSTGGMTLSVTYTDGSSKTVYNGWQVSGETNTVGRKTITVTYEGKSTTYSITVEEAAVSAIRIVTQPDKLVYTPGESIDLTGLELSVTRGGKSTSVAWPDDGITYEGALSGVGESVITIFYGGKSASLKVSVKEPTVTRLTVLALPDKTEYAMDGELDTAGMVLLAEYDDGTMKRITDGFRCFYDFAKPGDAVVSVTYGGATAKFTVTVLEPEKRFELAAEEITLAVDDTATLTFGYNGDRYARITCEVSDTNIAEVFNVQNGLYILALREGTCTITLSDGEEKAVCTVKVKNPDTEDKEDTEEETKPETEKKPENLPQLSVRIGHQAADLFMPVLSFNGNGISEETVNITMVVRYDSNKLIAADVGVLFDSLTVTPAGDSAYTISGTITIPKTGTVDAAYVMFIGDDFTAFEVSLS